MSTLVLAGRIRLLSNFKYLDFEHDIVKFKVPSDIARNNPFWEIYLVGYLDEPYAEEDSDYHTPRLDERYESYDKYYRIGFRFNFIWIYDRISETTILKTPL